MTRRDLFKVSTIALASMIVTPANASDQKEENNQTMIKKSSATRVVVCGAGFGGLTMAKYLRVFNSDVEVVVIDKKDIFVSCPYSNVWLGGVDGVGLEDLSRDYYDVAQKYGYSFSQATILDIDKKAKKVITNKYTIEYDYVVLALGIEYDYSYLFGDDIQKAIECQTHCPPALMPIGEHIALKRELKNLKGGNFVITVPSGVYRCPPAPYERACMVAHYIKKHKIDAKVLVYDPRQMPSAKPDGFLDTFNTLYKDIIEYHPSCELKGVDVVKKEITVLEFDHKALDYVTKKIPFAVANIIPKNKGHSLIKKIGIKTNTDGYAILKEPTFMSVSDESIYVVGDNTAYPYPKSAQMANSCAYLASKELAHKIAKKEYDVYSQTPANVCVSLVSDEPKEGLSVTHEVSFVGGIKVVAQDTKKRDHIVGESVKGWFDGIMGDIFS